LAKRVPHGQLNKLKEELFNMLQYIIKINEREPKTFNGLNEVEQFFKAELDLACPSGGIAILSAGDSDTFYFGGTRVEVTAESTKGKVL